MKELISVLLGYATIFIYIFVLIYKVGNSVKRRFDVETSRKVVHISLFMVWVLIAIFLRDTVHQIIIPICFLILNSISFKFKVFDSIERDVDNHFGTIYFAVAVGAVMTAAYIDPALFPYTGIAVFALTFGDGFAALVGHHTNSPKIHKGKSLFGSLACFGAIFIATIILKFVFSLEITIFNIFVLALLCTIFELVGFGLDNFFITIPALIMSYYLSTMSNPLFFASVYIAIAIFLIVFFTGAIDYPGAITSMCMVFCFGYFGGYGAMFFLIGAYFAIYVISIVSRKIKKDNQKTQRGIVQILINGGLGTFVLIVSHLISSQGILASALVVIAGCFIDSVSSDIGTLSKKMPYDILSKKHVEAGMSGGVTTLGTVSALIASAVCAVAICGICHMNFLWVLIVTPLIFLQTVVDTVLGSTIQAKYACSKCGKQIETPYHCDRLAIFKRGITVVNNNAVNLISSFIIMIISLFVLAL